MEKVERLGQARLGPQPLAQAVGVAALQLPEPYYEEIRLKYAARVSSLVEVLNGIEGVQAPRPRGAFYCMVDLPVDDTDRFARFLVTDFRVDGESVVVAPGGGFYAAPESGRTQIRLAAVIGDEALFRAGQILDQALKAYPGRQG